VIFVGVAWGWTAGVDDAGVGGEGEIWGRMIEIAITKATRKNAESFMVSF
jgi:hypothetical protein